MRGAAIIGATIPTRPERKRAVMLLPVRRPLLLTTGPARAAGTP
jgi:hypothetical protein